MNRHFGRVLWLSSCWGLMLLIPASALGIYMQADLMQIPVDKLVANLKKQAAASPDNAELQLNLGRVLAMAYAKRSKTVEVTRQDQSKAWLGYDPIHVPFANQAKSKNPTSEKDAGAFLQQAISHFEKAIELDPENLTAQLSRAWCLDKDGKEMEAISGYRQVIEKGWAKEKDMQHAGLGFHSVVSEAALYLKPKLNKQIDAEELADLQRKIEKVSKIMRPITPIAIPLGRFSDVAQVEDRTVAVLFDADGSGQAKHWSWITPQAGWLVYDQTGQGKIRSALQLFGNVTFWCFWKDGYRALASLDADQSGYLNGDELEHLAIWQDRNQNGISEPGEVRSLRHWQISEISCQSKELTGHIDRIRWSPRGVRFTDGSTRPTYDILLVPGKRVSMTAGHSPARVSKGTHED